MALTGNIPRGLLTLLLKCVPMWEIDTGPSTSAELLEA